MYSESEIGTRLVHARTLAGKSQIEIAEAAGLAPTQLSRYESGRSKPRPMTLKRLAEALDISPAWLATGEGAVNDHEFTEPTPAGQQELALDLPAEVIRVIRKHADEAGITMREQIRNVLIQFVSELEAGNTDFMDELTKRVAERLKQQTPTK